MIERISTRTHLLKAFKKVRGNRGSAGIDRQTIPSFEKYLPRHIEELAQSLRERIYEPLPLRRVFIPKAGGAKRPLGIPAVRDRVVQQAILSEIEPILEPLFSNASYGFRPGKSAFKAIEKVQELLSEGYEYIVDADIRDFFGTLGHQRLMARVRASLDDPDVTKLIWRFLKAGVMEEGRLKTTTAGTPQGGIMTPPTQ